jgi:putative transposase
VCARLRERNQLVLEILALRHQIAVLRRTGTRRPRLSVSDRLFWVFLSRWWSGWRSSLTMVRAETALGWRRQVWSLLWRFGRGRRWRGGRPRIASEIRDLIIRMARENFLWGAPRIQVTWRNSS